ncbi:hypothetical protein CAL14_15195 [Bordetella genomosp. 9]|uniref:low affinity iron permease family protein n=1 Tax=Bordetella genomosp. 9 TaxID=1416803 RepID=UPI000A295D49|nr:low affinity iron permease family protein [Bordetella genomosp. 9]ARP91462.1 hypothetical protein CAL14_15195 [Bordetella genomosp. 9]
MTTLRRHGGTSTRPTSFFSGKPGRSKPSGKPPRNGAGFRSAFDHFASKVTQWTGSPFAFGLATGAVLVWLICGPVFHYSETWQLVINTGTTIVTFLMVFLIQQSQNKDSHALHLKLDELLCALEDADSSLVDIEDMDEEEIKQVAKRYQDLAERARSASQEKARRRGPPPTAAHDDER